MAELNMGLFPQYQDPIATQARAFNYADAVRQNAAKYQAGGQYANGDYAGAARTQATSGNIKDAQETQQFGQQQAAKGQQYIAQALPVLTHIAQVHASDPDGGTDARSKAFDQIAGEAQQVTGATPQQMSQFKQLWVSDPQGFLSRIQASLPVEYKTAGDTLFQFRNGNLTGQYNGLKTITAPATDNIYQIGGAPAPAGGLQPPGGGSPSAPGGSPAAPAPDAAAPGNPSADQVSAAITKIFPGAIITSTTRTPEHNAEVGGVPDSMHLGGQAVDFVLPKGATFDQVKAAVAQSGLQVTELLNEGSHVHIGWAPKGQQVAQAAPQPQAAPPGATLLQRGQPAFRDPTAEEKQRYPGVSQMGANGQAHYPPASLAPTQLNPESIKQLAAIAIRNGGRLPPGYARDKATMAAVTNTITDLKPPGMSDDDFARVMQNNILQFEARKSAGGMAAKGQIGTSINEGTVNNSINILRKLIPIAASKGNFTQLNDLQQFIRRSSNDANAANFKNAVDSISNEYARVMTGATGGTASSDSARNEAAHRILLGYNGNTLQAVLNQMQQEMRGRSESYKAALSQLTGGYSGIDVPFDNGQASPTPAGGGTVIRYDAQGNRIK
jgi:hypothetical protein